VVNLNKEWDARMGNLCQQVDFTKSTNIKLEEEVRRLTMELAALRKRNETELMELETKTRDQEYQKYNNNLRRLETKLLSMEQGREITNKKYYDMIRELQQAEKKLNDELVNAENSADRLKQENADFKHRVEEMKILCDKVDKDVKLKCKLIESLEDELEMLTKKLVDQ